MSREDRFMQPTEDIEVLYSERLQRARRRVMDGEDADAVAAELAAEDVALELELEREGGE